MSIYRITFSPTGGTEKVADSVAKVFGREIITVDLTNTIENFCEFRFCSEDVCIVSVPSYGGRVPEIAVSRLRQMVGGGAKAILICVYGNRAYDDTLLELKNTLKDSGFCCMGAIAALAEHSIMHQFASGRPDEKDFQELTSFAEKIKRKIQEESNCEDLIVPGEQPYREYNGVPMKPKTDKTCIGCGLCASKCPVNAIPEDEPSKTNDDICISCMRCIDICPSDSRSVNKLILTVAAKKMKKACEGHKENELFL